MKNTIKKIISFSLISTAFMLTGCSEDNNSSDSSVQLQAELISLKSADINMSDDFDEIICTKCRKRDILIFGRLKTGEYGGYVTNSEFSEKTSFIFELQENEKIKSATLSELGKSAVLTVLDGETFIYIFNRNGILTDTINCGNLISETDYFVDIISCDKGFYISLARSTLVYVDTDGNFSENNDITNICGIFNNSDGVPCVLFEDNDKLTLAELDSNGITEKIVCDNIGSTINSVGAGTGDYQISAVCSDGLYSLNDDKWLKISDFSDNDFQSHNIVSVIMTEKNEYVITLHNENMTYEMRLLSERDISELKQKKIIKMVNTAGGNVDIYNQSIKKFNSENEEYKIEMVNYVSDDKYYDYDQILNDLERDILSGNAPDIVRFNSDIPGTFFVDLYPLIDSDTDINRDDFVEGFLEGMESDGKLLQIYPTFTINTLCIKDKFADGLKEWNFEQLESICKNLPDDTGILFGEDIYSRQDMFMQLFNYHEFIDLKNASCNFDSPEFIKRIQFINDNKIGLTGLNDVIGVHVDEIIYDFRNNHHLLTNAFIGSYYDFKIYEQVYGGESCTFIGFPSDNGNGSYHAVPDGYSIMADSQNIDGAWNFLKYYLFEEEDTTFRGFSGLEEKLSAQLENHKTLHTEENPETGEQENIDLYATFEPGASEPTVIALEPFSDEKATEYNEFVHNTVKNSYATDEKIRKILAEELMYYFEGECSAEEVTEIIQNRISVYLSEKYS